MARNRNFRRLGEVGPQQLDLPPARARQLQLEAAWRHVAGEVVARRATALAVRRGVLEVRVVDEGWASTLAAMIPELSRRLAAERPELGVREVRLVVALAPAVP